MKIETQKAFSPVTITIETQQEFDKIYAIFNHGTITQAAETFYIFDMLNELELHSDNFEKWYDAIDEAING